MTGETSFPVTANGYADPPLAHLAKLADGDRFHVNLTKASGL